jgi:hypothetical protein
MMTKSWAIAGGWCGVAAALIYLSLVLLPLPMSIARVLFFGVSLVMVVAMLGLWQVLRAHNRSVIIDVAAVFTVAGAIIMNLMAVTQNSLLYYANASVPQGIDAALSSWVLRSVHGVQLGLDVSFDIFFLAGVALLGLAMARHPFFGRVFGWTGTAAAASTLVLNMVHFPVPPQPDLGPFVGVWALAASIRLLQCARHLTDAEAPPVPAHTLLGA